MYSGSIFWYRRRRTQFPKFSTSLSLQKCWNAFVDSLNNDLLIYCLFALLSRRRWAIHLHGYTHRERSEALIINSVNQPKTHTHTRQMFLQRIITRCANQQRQWLRRTRVLCTTPSFWLDKYWVIKTLILPHLNCGLVLRPESGNSASCSFIRQYIVICRIFILFATCVARQIRIQMRHN